jgi:hypothetical protein
MTPNPFTVSGLFLILIFVAPVAILVCASGLPLVALLILIILKPLVYGYQRWRAWSTESAQKGASSR